MKHLTKCCLSESNETSTVQANYPVGARLFRDDQLIFLETTST